MGKATHKGTCFSACTPAPPPGPNTKAQRLDPPQQNTGTHRKKQSSSPPQDAQEEGEENQQARHHQQQQHNSTDDKNDYNEDGDGCGKKTRHAAPRRGAASIPTRGDVHMLERARVNISLWKRGGKEGVFD